MLLTCFLLIFLNLTQQCCCLTQECIKVNPLTLNFLLGLLLLHFAFLLALNLLNNLIIPIGLLQLDIQLLNLRLKLINFLLMRILILYGVVYDHARLGCVRQSRDVLV
jgi:hypothetical protein